MKNIRELFREAMENECKWSTPTFYRRILNPQNNSTAEKEMMIKVARARIVELLELIDREDQNLKNYQSLN
ncbi:hypothetical protein [Chitinophaga sp. MD30]|uniref:hypothetical protein n=2 Tax=Chitinophaga TaxID=79328 RepID=UPI001E50EA1C|nr:hypothetical protein [Chitinophaga sp. MD30]